MAKPPSAVGQLRPQAPQLSGSSAKLTLSASPSMPGHWVRHSLSTQAVMVLGTRSQTLPQTPQFSASFTGVVQTPPQSSVPAGHSSVLQPPSMQREPSRQA